MIDNILAFDAHTGRPGRTRRDRDRRGRIGGAHEADTDLRKEGVAAFLRFPLPPRPEDTSAANATSTPQ
ncbi:hypothetical protein ACRYCC_15075 [Actinomadura scrupuli]|uniref:hypothetical protein n=1 Tax=Actinomadura scrupuli TaxID=559629 RepID=UPI003D962BCF